MPSILLRKPIESSQNMHSKLLQQSSFNLMFVPSVICKIKASTLLNQSQMFPTFSSFRAGDSSHTGNPTRLRSCFYESKTVKQTTMLIPCNTEFCLKIHTNCIQFETSNSMLLPASHHNSNIHTAFSSAETNCNVSSLNKNDLNQSPNMYLY